jgi:hypothetical protein
VRQQTSAVVRQQTSAVVRQQTSATMRNHARAAVVPECSSGMLSRTSSASLPSAHPVARHSETTTARLHLPRPPSDFDNEEGAGCSFWVDNKEPK